MMKEKQLVFHSSFILAALLFILSILSILFDSGFGYLVGLGLSLASR
jgi:hypothetical protein